MVTTAPSAKSDNGVGDVLRLLLLVFAIVFLVLAAVPWQPVLHYRLGPAQELRWRIAFVAVSLSVGSGYVIATYLNGAA